MGTTACNQAKKDVETMTMLIHEHLDHSLKFIIEDMENRNIG